MYEFNKPILGEFRANRGVVGGQFAGRALLILTTTGARTGQLRENPLVFLADGDRYLIVASYRGEPINPPWYYNLISNPEVGVEMGSEKFRAIATVLDEPERTKAYAMMVAEMPIFTEYQKMTTRIIPVIALTPLGTAIST
ncbi:MAG: nitroreductase family deazaflavin-dependent oxidoreductase [Halieaceae bacterium]|nr:nitroreductase family deazaflavin-dependent oxidoreductase [Halieaceae bacterium]